MKNKIQAIIIMALLAILAMQAIQLHQTHAALADMAGRHAIQKVVSSRRAAEITNLKSRIEALEGAAK